MSMKKIDKEFFRQQQFCKSLKRIAKLSKNFLKTAKDLVSQDPLRYSIFYITLTFRDNNEFEKAKESTAGSPMGRYMWYLKRYLQGHGYKVYAYFWVLESQSRGVPHYHIFLISDAKKIPLPDKSFWPWGMSQVQKVPYSRISRSYLSKYLEKQEQKTSMIDNLIFKSMKKFYMYVCNEWKDFFFAVITSGYSWIRQEIAKRVEGFVTKCKGWWHAGLFKYKIHMDYVFWGKNVYINDNGVTVDVNGFILRFKTINEFCKNLDYIFIFV